MWVSGSSQSVPWVWGVILQEVDLLSVGMIAFLEIRFRKWQNGKRVLGCPWLQLVFCWALCPVCTVTFSESAAPTQTAVLFQEQSSGLTPGDQSQRGVPTQAAPFLLISSLALGLESLWKEGCPRFGEEEGFFSHSFLFPFPHLDFAFRTDPLFLFLCICTVLWNEGGFGSRWLCVSNFPMLSIFCDTDFPFTRWYFRPNSLWLQLRWCKWLYVIGFDWPLFVVETLWETISRCLVPL